MRAQRTPTGGSSSFATCGSTNERRTGDPPKRSGLGTQKAICLGISGFCVGGLTGLSVSPVIGIVLTSILSTLVASTSALAGLEVGQAPAAADQKPPADRRITIDPLPTAIVIGLITVGAITGIWVRTHGWLRTVPNNLPVGAPAAAAAPASVPAFRARCLFNIPVTVCDDLKATDAPNNEAAFEPASRRLWSATPIS